jgi:acetolactate synthase-1/2/3 large subunit
MPADFTLIEAAQAAQTGVAVPRPMLATHETWVAGAQLRYAVAADPLRVVHVSVGTANTICAAMNASRENVLIC